MHEANISGLITKFHFIDIRRYSFYIELFFLSVTHLKVVTVPSAFVQDTPLGFVNFSKYFRLSFAQKASLKICRSQKFYFLFVCSFWPVLSVFLFYLPSSVLLFFFRSFLFSIWQRNVICSYISVCNLQRRPLNVYQPQPTHKADCIGKMATAERKQSHLLPGFRK